MRTNSIKNNWVYALLIFAIISAILALTTSEFIYKSGTAAVGILIIFILNIQGTKPIKDTWLIIAAFFFSIVGDWFLTHMNGDSSMFTKGIALFFLAHLGYLFYALLNGIIRLEFTLILLIAYLAFFYFILYPTFSDTVLMLASLTYLLVSCLSVGAAAGIKADPVVKWAFVFGIVLILFSDTIISLKEFLKYTSLDFLILPTYYLAHISITFSLIRKARLQNKIDS